MSTIADKWNDMKPLALMVAMIGVFVLIMSAPGEWCARVARNRWMLREAQLVNSGERPFLLVHAHSEAHYKETPLERLVTIDLADGSIIASYIGKNRISLLGATDTSLLLSEGGMSFGGSKGSREYAIRLPGFEKLYDLDALLKRHGDIRRRFKGIRLERYSGDIWLECSDSVWFAYDLEGDTLSRLSREQIEAMRRIDWGVTYERVDRTVLMISDDGSSMAVHSSLLPEPLDVKVGKAHFGKPQDCDGHPLPPRMVGDTLLLERRFLCDNARGQIVVFEDGDRIVAYQDLQGETGKLLFGRLDTGDRFIWRLHERDLFGARGRDEAGYHVSWATMWRGRLVVVIEQHEGGDAMYAVMLEPEDGTLRWKTTLK
ncbi:MAG: hypothetical protein GF331_04290 [Chitinivibrionales bacterium]|nr:hypothetical protein [Chitinivibrionales bacterium]